MVTARIRTKDLKGWRKGGRLAVEALGLNRWFVNACIEAGWDVVVADPVKLGLRMHQQRCC